MQAEQIDNTMDLFLSGLRSDLVMLAESPVLKQGGNITVYIDQPADEKDMIPMTPQAKGGLEAAAYELFRQFGETHKDTVSVISYGTTDGGYLQWPAISRKKGYDSRARGWFKDSMAAPNDVRVTKPFMTSKGTPTLGIFAVTKGNDGKPLGVIGLNIDLPVVTNMISEIQVGETGYMMLLDADGVIVADPRHKEAAFKNIAESGLGDIEKLANEKSGVMAISLDGMDKFANIYTSDKTGYKYITIVDKNQLMSGLNQVRKILVAVLIVALLLIVGAMYWISNKIAQPLKQLEGAAGLIAKGDLRNTELDIRTQDEIGQLAGSFKQMTVQLKELLQQIQGSSQEVSAFSGQLSQSTEQCADTIVHVAENVSSIAASAQEEDTAIQTVVEHIRAMTEKVAAIAKRAEDMSDSSQNAGRVAQDGRDSIEQAVRQMEKIRDTVNRSAEAVAVLGNRSQQIGDILNTISDIAAQTNLLALNAAIEAARAGEHGRGFAVVADEVRKLAEQSQAATGKIAEIIQAIQQETKNAVGVMQAGTEEVRAGGEIVGAAGQRFAQIASTITDFDQLIQASAQDAVTTADNSRQILSAAENARNMTRKVTEEIGTISAATEEQSASMEEMAASSHNLATMAEKLQQAANKFHF